MSASSTFAALDRARETGPPRVDGVLLGSLAFTASALSIVAPWPTIVCAALIAAFAWTQKLQIWAAVAIALFALGAARASSAIDAHERDVALVHDVLLHPARCAGVARVTSSPAMTGDVLRWDADFEGATCDGQSELFRGRASVYGEAPVARGDAIEAVVDLARLYRFANAELEDARPREARRGALASGGVVFSRILTPSHGLAARIDHVRASVRARISATFPRDTEPMARALVLGESSLATDDDDAFRASGLSHLLAVSGMHLVLVVATFVAATRMILVRIPWLARRVVPARLAATLGVPLAWVYADFAGGSGSAWRAAWMMSVHYTCISLGRRPDATRALALSIAAMAVFDPLVAFDVSFQLSAAATVGLIALSRPLSAWLRARLPRWASPLAASLATTTAATIPCAPMLARISPTLPAGGLAANVIAVPLGELAALPLCLLHAVISRWPSAERGAALLASGALVLVRAIARFFAHASIGRIPVPTPTPWQLAAIATFAGALWLKPRGARVIALAAVASLAFLELAERRAAAPHGELVVTFLDVGQGDAALVDLPNGDAMLIDGGGLVGSPVDIGRRVLAPVLRARRRDRLRAVILSHPHPDHFGGLNAGLAGIRVDELWDTGQGENEGVAGAYAAVLSRARENGTKMRHPSDLCGRHEIGGAIVDVLEPCPAPSSDRPPNDNSLVMRITYGDRAVLFEGDAERDEEADLAKLANETRADVLKVGHHGSRTSSSPALLARIAPRDAVISCGVRNRYGHPSPPTLDALYAVGARIWRTDEDGAITLRTDGRALTMGRAMDLAR